MVKAYTGKIKGKIVSSCEKVLWNKEPKGAERRSTMLKNERLNFQLAFFNDAPPKRRNRLIVRGELAPYVTLRSVENVPDVYTAQEADDYYVGKEPGLYPDLLKPIGDLGVVLPDRQWKSVWVSLEKKDGLPAGKHTLSFDLVSEAGQTVLSLSYTVEVLDLRLAESDLKMTNWMHYDCICTYHKLKPFSKAFYGMLEKYLRIYVDCGFTLLLTPLFTPPLDTAIGSERPTVQLIGVEVTEEGYRFDFGEFRRFVAFAKKNGIKYFELSHLFTQWGGKCCPKIVAKKNGRLQKIFGWETPSDSREYRDFLRAFLPALYQQLVELGIDSLCYVHLTDEPSSDGIEAYAECCRLVKESMPNIPTIDALSKPIFFERGLVDIPVPSIHHSEPFADLALKERFAYCCCFPNNGYYSNRFINMPGERTRILGMQLYKNETIGFLHWGFNFYYSVLSLEPIDPYADTNAGGIFPAGDGFIVYPADEPRYSQRAELLKEAEQDYRALKVLESFAGKEAVMALLEEAGVRGYNEFPHGAKAFMRLRNEICARLKAYIG